MAEQLTIEKLNEYFEYRDGQLFWKKPRKGVNKSPNGDYPVGWNNGSGYIKLKFMDKTYYAHHIVFFMHHGRFPVAIDHIDGNRSNNRIDNIREATLAENNRNIRPYKRNPLSGGRGVIRSANGKKWMVRVHHDGKSKHLGTFDDLEFANLVAQEARNKFHGNFARHD